MTEYIPDEDELDKGEFVGERAQWRLGNRLQDHRSIWLGQTVYWQILGVVGRVVFKHDSLPELCILCLDEWAESGLHIIQMDSSEVVREAIWRQR